jgi:hypothetical protein
MTICILCKKVIQSNEEKVLTIPEGEKSWKRAVWVHKVCLSKKVEAVTGQKKITTFRGK